MPILKIDGVDGALNEYKHIYTALANGTIAKGATVEVETDPTATPDPDLHGYNGQVVKSCGTTSSTLCIGVALEAATEGQKVRVQCGGMVDSSVTGTTSAEAIAIGQKVSASTSGEIRIYDSDSATTASIGVCVGAYSGATADGKILLYDKGWLG